MLKLTKKADYGLIAMKHLAAGADAGLGADVHSSASAKEIADQYGIPLPILAKVLQKLVRGGFLRSEHGVNGGYRLARDPREITALGVIGAINGPVLLASCFGEGGGCHHSDRCTVRDPLRKVHEGILRLLAGISIWDMLQEEQPADCAPAVALPIEITVGSPALRN